jgi:outer membrane receptor protein involved in Fe transport
MFVRILRSALAAVLFSVLNLTGTLAQATSTIHGTVVNASSQGTVAGARIEIRGQGIDKTTVSDSTGAFTFSDLAPGSYTISVAATGYNSGAGNPIVLSSGEVATLVAALQPVSMSSLKQIAVVSVSGTQTVNTGSAPTITITKTDFIKNGNLLIEQGLEDTPGVTIQHFDGGLGSVATLAIRGAGGMVAGSDTGYEVLVLQDGEPMRNGQYGDFDLSTLTPSIYQRAEVLLGVGGTSLFGANAIGGTLNLVTIDPQATAGGQAIFQVGSFGTTSYDFSGTDTVGKFGWVFDVHRMSTEGSVPANFVADYATNGCDSTCLWNPAQTFDLQSGLIKLQYHFSPTTYLTIGAQDEADIRGQLGLLTNATTNSAGDAYDDLGYPYFYGEPGDALYNNQPKFFADLHTQLFGGDLLLRSYAGTLNRIDDGNNEPPGICCYYQVSVDRLYGDELIWDKASDRSELTLGYGGNGDSYYYGDAPYDGNYDQTLNASLLAYTGGTQVERTALARYQYQLTQQLRVDGTLYYSTYDTLQVRRFDPRIGLVYRPDPTSAVRLSYATGFAPPILAQLYDPLNLSSEAAGSDPRCPSTEEYCVASSGNPNLKSESAVGWNLGFDKTFLANRGLVTFDLYRTNLSDHIFTANLPAPAGLTFDNGTPALFVSTPINLAGSVYTGFEASARIPIVGDLAATGYYTTQSAYPTGVDYYTEVAAGDLVNNQQYDGVPLHQASYGLDFLKRSRFEVFANAVYFGPNNSYDVPAFWVYNTGAVIPLANGNQFNISWNNLGNKNATIFELYDQGVPYPGVTGPYLTSAHPYVPTMFIVTFSHSFGSLAPH